MTQNFGYRFDTDGLWYVSPPKKDAEGNEVESPPVWLCAPLVITALAVDEKDRWGKLLEWHNPDGKIVRWVMADRLLAEKDKLWQSLRDRGLNITTKTAGLNLLLEFLNSQDIDKRVHVVDRLGWWDKEGLSFVLPDRILGTANNIFFNGDQLAYQVKGTLTDWQQQIGRFCCGNSRLLFGASIPFATPLLYLLNEPSGGFHYHGLSQKGKTTALQVAASVVGCEMNSWRTTDNGLEGLAEQRCDSLLILDEMAQVDAHAAGRIAYMVANGAGKGRAAQSGEAKHIKRWRTLLLSSGEITLADKMNEAGAKRRGGQEVRLADIPADAGVGMGIFENLHGAPSPGKFAEQLRRATQTFCGAPFLAYLEKLIAVLQPDTAAEVVSALRDQRDQFIAGNLPAEAAGQVRSVCGRFGVVAIAGDLATTLGITGWSEGEATAAAQTCFKAWLAKRGTVGDHDIEEGIRQVIAFMEKYATSRFETIYTGGDEVYPPFTGYAGRVGYRQQFIDSKNDSCNSSSWHYYVLPHAWKDELTKGYDSKTIATEMAKRGLLIRGGKLQTKKRSPDGKSVWVYHLSPDILSGEE
jgi:putative DNA primase/helicase